jgi:hypothetical protein
MDLAEAAKMGNFWFPRPQMVIFFSPALFFAVLVTDPVLFAAKEPN